MAAEEEGCSVLGKWEFQKALQQSILLKLFLLLQPQMEYSDISAFSYLAGQLNTFFLWE